MQLTQELTERLLSKLLHLWITNQTKQCLRGIRLIWRRWQRCSYFRTHPAPSYNTKWFRESSTNWSEMTVWMQSWVGSEKFRSDKSRTNLIMLEVGLDRHFNPKIKHRNWCRFFVGSTSEELVTWSIHSSSPRRFIQSSAKSSGNSSKDALWQSSKWQPSLCSKLSRIF